MTFDELLIQAVELLQREGRVSYRALKRRFALDDEYLEDLKVELIDAKRVAVDEDGKVLVWVGKRSLESRVQSLESEGQGRDSTVQTLDPRRQTLDSASERRQLTVMFCDIVGSTALSTQLDPEDFRAVIQAYRETCATVIRRFEGYLAKYIGDGLLVYFGYPVAHEDDAARAVRASLGIVAAIEQLLLPNIPLPFPVQVRIGVHTGLVVAGEMGTEDQPEPLAIVGETPNIAARLQERARPNSVVISVATSRLITGLFELQDLGPQALKGTAVPMSVYQVVRESEAQSRFEVAVRTGLTPLIGRAHEVGLLQERWERAKQGEGQAVLLSGEAGIGKSRLVQEFKEQVSREGATCLAFRCSPYHQNSAFYPIIEHAQRLLQFEREETPEDKLRKLEHVLTRRGEVTSPLQKETLVLFASLLSLPHPDGVPSLTLSPQKQKQKTQEALVAWLVEEAERTPVYCAWEDLHWADPSTVEVLHLLLAQVPTARMLTLLTFRPEFTPPWGSRSHIIPLTLGRLASEQVEELVAKISGSETLSTEMLRQIVSKTDGVPLFVEELTKAAMESVGARPSTSSGAVPLPQMGIPATLHDALMARLDRMGPAKEIAQLGATLGREFSYEVLQAISPLAEETLQRELRQLVEAELIYQRGMPPQAQYLFKHALIQDVAYQSLLKSTRQHYHRQIARVIEERFNEIAETQPELLAHHYTEAGLIEQAIPYWQQAGERTAQRSAYVEAVNHLTKGLDLLKTLTDTSKRAQQELMLQTTLGATLVVTKGYAAPEVERSYTRALALCQQVGETPQLFPVLMGLWRLHLLRAELPRARELAEQVFRLAQNTQDSALLLWPHLALGLVLSNLGELSSALVHLEQSTALYSPQKHRPNRFQVNGQDPKVTCLSYEAWTLWRLGYPNQARKKIDEALTLARELSHPFSLAFAMNFAAALHQFLRDVEAVQEWAEALVMLSREQGFPFWLAGGARWQGWVLAEWGHGEEGLAQIRRGLTAYKATGAEQAVTHFLALLAEVCGRVGQVEEGLSVLAEALTIVDKTGERWCEAELYRLRGELTLQQQFKVQSSEFKVPSPQHLTPSTQVEVEQEAEGYFLKAIEISRKQQAKSLELRAATSLARLWQQQGKHHEAYNMLAEIYGWFTEGFDTKDLQEAKALLAELDLLVPR